MANKAKRENYDAFWLERDDFDKEYAKFQHLPVKEKKGAREFVKSAIAEAILDHHFHRQRINAALKRLGFEKAARYFSTLLPKEDKTRKGNFGEVIASEHLCQRYGYKMPVFKLRFMDTPKMPMRGEDIVAFKIEDNKIAAICIGEAKTLEDYSTAKVIEAHERLDAAYHPYPITLSLISNILYEKNDHDLAGQIDVILETLGLRSFPRDNWIFIITGDQPHDPLGPIEEIDGIVENLRTVSLHLPRLSYFIKEIFENPGIRS
jgi:hypothetical protein